VSAKFVRQENTLTLAIDALMTDAITEKTEGKRPRRKGKARQKEKEEEEEEEEEMTKPAPAGYVKVDNERQCALCQKDRVICQINLVKIEKWRTELESSKVEIRKI
jgi:hypothetical protein